MTTQDDKQIPFGNDKQERQKQQQRQIPFGNDNQKMRNDGDR